MLKSVQGSLSLCNMQMDMPGQEVWSSTVNVVKYWLALHLVGGGADCIPEDAVLLLQSSDLALQLLPHLLELHMDGTIQSACSLLKLTGAFTFFFILNNQIHLSARQQIKTLTFICMVWSSW